MKAARLHEYGDADLSIEDVSEPELTGPEDVIVRVGGAGVCRTDLHVMEGILQDAMPSPLPITLGHETAGWIEDLGTPVDGLEVGDPVILHPLGACGMCEACRRGEDMYCPHGVFPGITADGGFAEYIRTSIRTLLAVPEGIEPAQIAPLADAGVTAYRAARKAAEIVEPGDAVVVIGTGGVGHIALQVLHSLCAARVIAIDDAEGGRDLAGRVGADEVLPTEESADRVRDATNGHGARVVLDFVGEHETPRNGLDMLAQGGAYIAIGYGGQVEVPTLALVLGETRIEGSLLGNYEDFRGLMELVRNKKVDVQATQYSLDDVNTALGDLAGGRIHGRGVLVP